MESAAALASPDLANQSKEREAQKTTHIANLTGLTPRDGSWMMLAFPSGSSLGFPSGEEEEEEQHLVKLRRSGWKRLQLRVLF